MVHAVNYTELMFDRILDKPNVIVPWYLSLSYAYYVLDESLADDWAYDKLCKMLDRQWDSIKHQHKYLIDRSSLSAGTGYALDFDGFPTIIKASTALLIKDLGRQPCPVITK